MTCDLSEWRTFPGGPHVSDGSFDMGSCNRGWVVRDGGRDVGAAIGVGLIGQGASVAVGRNPGASTKIMVQSILAIAFAEAVVFYALFLVR